MAIQIGNEVVWVTFVTDEDYKRTIQELVFGSLVCIVKSLGVDPL